MKRYFLLALGVNSILLLQSLLSIKQVNHERVIILFNGNSSGNRTIYFNDEFNHTHQLRVVRDNNSKFSIDTLLIDTAVPIQLRFPKEFQQNPVYVFPGDTIHAFFSNSRTPAYNFKGAHNSELNFLIFLESKNIGISHLDLTTLAWNDKINTELILQEHDRLYASRLQILNHYADSLHFAPKYQRLFKSEIELVHLLGYLQPFFNLENKEKLPLSYFDKLDSYKKWLSTDTTMRACFWYRFAVMSYNMYLNREHAKADFFKHLYFSTAQNFDKPIRYFVQFHLLHDEKDKTSPLYQECYNDFKKNCPFKDYITHLEEEEKAAKLSADSLVHNSAFRGQILKDINGENISWANVLEQNKGKIIYVDMWASWCAPCRAEMPNSIKLQKELSNHELTFVYISIDNDKTKWLKAITATGLIGKEKQHYLLAPDSELAKFLTPNGIPKYFIIDKEGKVAQLEAPRPSDPKIKQIFDDLLKK